MIKNELSPNAFEKKIEVYYIPLTEAFNIAPFHGNVSSTNNIDTHEILDEYRQKFESAWSELADK